MSLRYGFRAPCLIVLLALIMPALAFGQANTGQISGRVTDGTGAVLPGVAVTATQTSTGLVRTTVTNEQGQYVLPALPIGPYRLEVALQGFRTAVREDITLQVNANIVADSVLQLGELEETVTVAARPSEVAVETRGVGVGTVVEQERILELPLSGRQVTDLITLSGAAVQVGQSPGFGMATGVNISVAGGSRFGVAYMLDGAFNSNRFDATSMPQPFPDALQEFRVSTSTQEASTGRASGAAVNAVTTSGTNVFHGNAFWFGRDAKFNAVAADALEGDGLQRHQPGGSLGGPLVRNRLFFFTGYQGTLIEQAPSSQLSIVPTAAMLRGDFTAFNRCYNPTWNTTSGAAFRTGTVNPATFSPAAVALSARLPQAQNDCGEVRWGTPIQRHDKQSVTRVDFQHSQNHSFFGRYMVTLHDQDPNYQADNVLTSGQAVGFNDRAHSVVLGHTWVINSQTLASSRVAYNRVTVSKQGARFFSPEDVGINQWTSVPGHFGFSVTGAFSLGNTTVAQREMWQNQIQVGTDVSLSRGNHQFGLGGTFERANALSIANTRGVGAISFTSTATGNPMGDFLLGRVDNIRQSQMTTISPQQDYISFYAQDDWRATPRLSLNYGVRWEPFLPMSFRDNPQGGIRLYSFSADRFKAGQRSAVFPDAPAGLMFPSQNADGSGAADFPGQSPMHKRWDYVAPRFGFSFDPTGTGTTSIRGGYGFAYDTVEMQSMLNATNTSPWVGDVTHRGGTLNNPWQGFPGGNPFPFDWTTSTRRFTPDGSFMPYDPDIDMTRVQSYNLAVQQQLGGQWLAALSYIGSYTTGLWNTTAVNDPIFLTQQSHPHLFTGPNTCVLEGVTFTPCNAVANINQRRELRLWAAQNDPARLVDARLLSAVDEFRSDSQQTYNGMLATVRGSILGVNLNANYTLSKCMTDRVNVGIANPFGTFHVGRDRQPCGSDRRHLFNLTTVASTPEFDGAAMRALASNWRVSAIYRFRSGAPHSIGAGSDRALSGLGGQLAEKVSDDVYLDESGELGSQFLDRNAFALPALGTYSSSLTFGEIRGFNWWTFDTAVSRIFNLPGTASQRIEVRVEAFNLLNAVVPTDPVAANLNISSSNFGRVTQVEDPRIMQFAVKYIF